LISDQLALDPKLEITLIEAHTFDRRLKSELEDLKIKFKIITSEDWLRAPIQVSKSDMLIASRFHSRLLFSRAGVKSKHLVVGTYYAQKHDDNNSKVFLASDTDLKCDFGLSQRNISYLLWRGNCLFRAKLFEIELRKILFLLSFRKRIAPPFVFFKAKI
jgi:hypothetical protein